MHFATFLVFVALISSSLTASTQAAGKRFISIGTGGVTGVYYPTGGAICRLLNQNTKTHGIHCTAEATGGSIYNINSIRAGELQFGIAQSDWQFHALKGTSKFKSKGPYKDLRAVFSVYPEPFTVVARVDSNIKNFKDLKGKRVNIGHPGSGQRGTMEVILKSMGWTTNDFKLASELKSSEQSQALCDNKIDAMVFTVGHPSGSIKQATTSCNVVLVNVTGPAINALIEKNSFYRKAVIPGGMYRGTKHDVTTFGVGATVVSSSRVSTEIVYEAIKAVFDNFAQFKKLHPAFANITKESMANDGISAPWHDGAKKYFQEKNIILKPRKCPPRCG